jgi:uncharacterized glyoxalase superfamily protein PhnB
MKSKFPGAVPEIPVRDINEAAAYYESNLGFTVDRGLRWRGTWTCRYLKGKLPGVFGELRPSKGIRQHSAGVDLAESGKQEEFDDLYRLWSDGKAKLIAAPESEPWGLHEFTAADPDGNLVRVFYDFATPERAKNA